MNRIRSSVIAFFIFGTISIGATAEAPWYHGKKSPTSQVECENIGGEWTKTPFFQIPFCRIKFTDDGKNCSRSSECKSQICVIESSGQVLGKCHGEAEKFATFWYLDENGKPGSISVE
jgi:hypothetical protein